MEIYYNKSRQRTTIPLNINRKGRKIFLHLILLLLFNQAIFPANLSTYSVTDLPAYALPDSEGIPLDHKLLNFLNYKGGFFIEIGAYDGIAQSNTKLLEEIYGWQGILIEPSKSQFSALRKNRPKSICLCCAVGSFEENGTFAYGDFDGTFMSSFTGRLANKKRIRVFIRSLQSILDDMGITHVNFLSLDTEGYELNILKGIDFDKTTFDYMLIEIYKTDFDTIVKLLSEKKYTLISNFSNYNKKSNPIWDGTHNDYLFKRDSLK